VQKMNRLVTGSSEQRNNEILDAGLALVLKNGLRGTSMEQLAREAGIAKPTLYSYFSNKDAVFRAIAERLFGQMRQRIESSLSGSGDLSFRISLALSAKHKMIFTLLAGSPHSEEIYSENSKFASKEICAFEDWLQLKIDGALANSDRQFPQNYGKLLIACSYGITNSASDASEIGPAIRLMVTKMLA